MFLNQDKVDIRCIPLFAREARVRIIVKQGKVMMVYFIYFSTSILTTNGWFLRSLFILNLSLTDFTATSLGLGLGLG